PDGLIAEAEYDLGILMREDPRELLEGDPRSRARWLARRSGLDATAIWEWVRSNGYRPGCSAPRSGCSRPDATCSPPPGTWPGRGPAARRLPLLSAVRAFLQPDHAAAPLARGLGREGVDPVQPVAKLARDGSARDVGLVAVDL